MSKKTKLSRLTLPPHMRKPNREFGGLWTPSGQRHKKGFRPTDRTDCRHRSCLPEFDEEASKGLDEYEVRKRWPRFDGECPECGGLVISYASAMHFVRGDW